MGKSALWPLFTLLIFVITAPTVSVLWFMMRAVTNERAAVRERLLETYESRLNELQPALSQFWEDRLSSLSKAPPTAPGLHFLELVTSGSCDSAIIRDGTGAVLYPSTGDTALSELPALPPEWARAERLEYGEHDLAAAAELFERLANQAGDVNIAAIALQAEIRCLMKAGRTEDAAQLLTSRLAQPKYRHARNHSGRLVVPNVQLLVLQAAESRTNEMCRTLLQGLIRQAGDYTDPALPSGQRLFIMNELRSLTTGATFPTSRAERLADEYLDSGCAAPVPEVLTAAVPGRIWQMATSNRTVIALYTHDRLAAEMAQLLRGGVALRGATVRVEPMTTDGGRESFVRAEACRHLPGWELRVYLDGADPFAAAAHRQVVTYFWIAILTVLSVLVLALNIGRRIFVQVRVTRMRNDFLATISHELKTPLASSRLLVDTLLDGTLQDEHQRVEYLALIAKENERLSRLIESFLTYSRMERNKQAFDIREVSPGSIIQSAVESVRDLREAEGFAIALESPPELPTIMADRDAMITVVLNLIDNACKYSGDARRICVSAYASDTDVCFEVQDSGLGMSQHDAKRVFDRFYQADHTLSRQAGGCGLGLSIVKFIVAAHHGTIDLQTDLGNGSTFTIKIPTQEA